MQTQVSSIVTRKGIREERLKTLRDKYIASAYKDILEDKSIREIHKNIRKVSSVQIKDGLPYSKQLESFVMHEAKKYKDNVGVLIFNKEKEDFAEYLHRKNTFSKSNSVIYDDGRAYEGKLKDDLLKNELDYNRHLENPKIFYLASSHSDCAKDHKDYQNRVYFDEKWKSYVKSPELRREIQNCINQRHMKSFQWVTGKPVWFITRPNCRHYFKPIPTSEVLGHTYDELTEKYKMYRKVGSKRVKTLKHPLNKTWYVEENVESIIRKYSERLHYHQFLYKIHKTGFLSDAIRKDKYLITKWSNYLQNALK